MATLGYMSPDIFNAINFANMAHKNQKRKGSEIDYVFHVLEAGYIAESILNQMNIDLNNEMYVPIVCAAILHDVIEDTKIPQDLIKNHFEEKVLHLVQAESEDKTKSWQERKEETINELKSSDIDIKIVALCDKLSNLRSIKRDYLVLGESLWERFKVKDKNKIGWYYKSMGDCFEELKHLCEYKEYKALLKEVFGD